MGRGAPFALLAEAIQKIERGQLAQERAVAGPHSQDCFKILHKCFFRAEMKLFSQFFEARTLKGAWSFKEKHDYLVQVLTPTARDRQDRKTRTF